MRRPVLFLVITFVCLLGTAVAAAFAPSFSSSPNTKLVGGIELGGGGYQLTSDSAGAGTVAWVQQKLVDGVAGNAGLRVRQQNPGGGWTSAVRIGAVGEIDDMLLVEDPSGAAAVIWTGEGGIDVATRASAHGTWSAPQMLPSTASASVDYNQIAAAIDAAGVVTVAWAPYSETSTTIFSATVNTADRTATDPVRVAAGDLNVDSPLSLSENQAGVAVLSWQRQLSPTRTGRSSASVRYGEIAAVRSAAGTWGPSRQLGSYDEPTVFGAGSSAWGPSSATSAVSANGTVVVGWRDGGPESPAPLEVATRSRLTGKWTTGRILTKNLGGFAVAAGPRNSLVAVWSNDTRRQNRLFSAIRVRGGRWSAAKPVAYVRGGTEGPYLIAARDGRIGLTPETGNDSAVDYAARGTNARWSSARKAGTGQLSEVAFGAHNALTVVWETFSHHGDSVSDTLRTRTVHV